MTPQFSQMLSQILYNQPDLRLSVLKSLRILIESQVSLSSEMDRVTSPWGASALTPEEASANIAFLKAQSDSWFAVLFNVFGSAGRDGQGVVGDVIVAWASITDSNVCSISIITPSHNTNIPYRRCEIQRRKLSTFSRTI